MACFLVTAAEAVAVTCVAQGMKHSEMKADSVKLENKAAYEDNQEKGLTWSAKLMLLAKLLWGGALLLAFEHVWHGEVVPWFPFLTAMGDPGDTAEMLHEMSTIGVTMAIIVTAVWAVMMMVCDAIANRPDKEPVKAAV